MKLIIGLGNPGEQYNNTRHNIGYRVIDSLAGDKIELKHSRKLKAYLGQFIRPDDQVLLAKPTVYMNESGGVVTKIIQYYKISSNQVLIISDDTNLDFGLIRTRYGGSDGGHNGLKSIISLIGADFYRLRIGVKNSHLATTQLDQFVLSNFTKEEASQIGSIIAKAAEVVGEFIDNEMSPTTVR